MQDALSKFFYWLSIQLTILADKAEEISDRFDDSEPEQEDLFI